LESYQYSTERKCIAQRFSLPGVYLFDVAVRNISP
jgi:hypothetical protein